MYFLSTFKKIFTDYLWMCWVLVSPHRLSLAVASGGYSLAVAHGLHIVVTPLAAEHRLQRARASVVVHGLVTPRHVESSQGVNLCPLHQQEGS